MKIAEAKSYLSRGIRKFGFNLVPLDRKLPFLYWLHILGGSYENELKHLTEICQGGKAAIDVGANEGLFSYVLAKNFEQVYAFEVNDELTKYLEAYNPGNVEIINQGLSSENSEATLYIPIRPHDGYALIGYASLAPGNYPDAIEHREKDVKLCVLDELNLNDVDFIKIDVEGHELEVLKGGINTLNECRPTVLVEIKDENLEDTFSFFKQLKFQKYKLEDLINVSSSRENYIFVPQEKFNFL